MAEYPKLSALQLTCQDHVLPFQPPYAWSPLRDFYASHPIPAQEWLGDRSIGRTFALEGAMGYFTAQFEPTDHAFSVTLAIDQPAKSDRVLAQIRHMLDLDISPATIEQHLHTVFPHLPLINGLRIPRVWSTFEAGIRAILGQQISVGAASKLVNTLVETLGQPIETTEGLRFIFPSTAALCHSTFDFLGMVSARRETLKRFVQWYATAGTAADDPHQWLPLKGIGPWTVNSAAMRGRGDTNMWVGGDLGIRKAMKVLDPADELDPTLAAPWCSYLTQQLWSQPAAWAPARQGSKKR